MYQNASYYQGTSINAPATGTAGILPADAQRQFGSAGFQPAHGTDDLPTSPKTTHSPRSNIGHQSALTPRTPLFILLCVLCASVVNLPAQTARWTPNSGTLAHNQYSDLTLTFENCDPKTNPALPSVSNLDIAPNISRGEQNSYSFINGQSTSTRTVNLTYKVRPTSRDPLTIPAFTVQTDKGSVTVPAASYTIGEATIGRTQIALDTIATSKLHTPKTTLWQNQVIPLAYQLNAHANYIQGLGSHIQWNPAPLAIEDWSQPAEARQRINAEPRVIVTYTTRALAKTPGKITTATPAQLVNITTGSSGFGFFQQPQIEQYTITAPPLDLDIKPLPQPAPKNFNNIVGTFTLETKVVPETAAVGEPVTWTLTLNGTGNWPDINALPPRALSRDFRVIQPQAKRTLAENKLYDGTLTEDLVLIPTQPGRYTLPPVTLEIFDPELGQYKTLTTPETTITITPATTTTPPEGGARSPSAPSTPTPTPVPQNPPGAAAPPHINSPISHLPSPLLPSDPLPDANPTPAPLLQNTLLKTTLIFPAALLLAWLAQALNRARLRDPRRPQRQAKKQLQKLLPQLAALPAPTQTLPPVGAALARAHSNQNTPTTQGTSTNAPAPGTAGILPADGAAAKGGARSPSAPSNATPTPAPQNPSGAAAPYPLPAPRYSLLLKWQHLTAQLHAITKNTPTAADLPDPDWQELWRATDRALYSADAQLPNDWHQTAFETLSSKKIPPFNPLRLIRHLIPLLLAALILAAPVPARAQNAPANTPADAMQSRQGGARSPSAPSNATPTPAPQNPSGTAAPSPLLHQYTSADYPAAEATLRAQLARTPTDANVRHNLSLVLAQQDRWAEAAAHALASVLQNPRQAAARRQLRYTLTHAGFVPPALAPLLSPKPDLPHRLAIQLSPARWQQLLLAALALATLVLIHALHRAYHPKKSRSKLLLATRCSLLVSAIALAAIAFTALRAYGTLSDPRATLVIETTTLRSIPTDLDTPQKTTTINPGHIALSTKEFLTWRHLQFPTGQTGWIRQETQIPLYK